MSTPEPDVNQVPEEEPAKRKRGRPPGAKNKTPYERGHVLTQDKLRELYSRTSQYMDAGQRKYIKGVINGSVEVDPIRELELLVRQCSLMFSEAAAWHFENKRVNRDIASFADTTRAAIKDLFELRRKQDELDASRAVEDQYSVTQRKKSVELVEQLLNDV